MFRNIVDIYKLEKSRNYNTNSQIYKKIKEKNYSYILKINYIIGAFILIPIILVAIRKFYEYKWLEYDTAIVIILAILIIYMLIIILTILLLIKENLINTKISKEINNIKIKKYYLYRFYKRLETEIGIKFNVDYLLEISKSKIEYRRRDFKIYIVPLIGVAGAVIGLYVAEYIKNSLDSKLIIAGVYIAYLNFSLNIYLLASKFMRIYTLEYFNEDIMILNELLKNNFSISDINEEDLIDSEVKRISKIINTSKKYKKGKGKGEK